jgi:effector-binding domain-containing protein
MKTSLKLGLGILLVFIVSNFFLTKDVIVERSIEIERPINQVFMKVANIKEWQNWDPWCSQDSTLKVTYPATIFGANAQRTWVSEESGSGEMTFTTVELNKRIEFDLLFLEPFDSEAKAVISFEQIKGKTKVSWSMHQEYPFLLRVFGLLADNMIGPDFELGLQNLKSYVEAIQDPFHILMFDKAEFYVYSKKENCTTADIGTTLETAYGNLIAKMAEDEITIFGKPICIYHSYTDTEVELEAALPVHQITKTSEYTQTIPAATVLKATYVGAYDKTQAAYDALDTFAAKNELSISDSHYQIFITDPGTVTDSNKWVTEIYYTILKK